jgi:hypothetical protein
VLPSAAAPENNGAGLSMTGSAFTAIVVNVKNKLNKVSW